MKAAIGYVRVSTDKQASEGVSLEAQEARIKSWCEANGYELVKVFVDAGISGKSMEARQGLKDALGSLKKDMALVSYSLSRLARSTKDALEIAEKVSKKKAHMVSLSEAIDGTTAAGRMMFQMLCVLAEFERNLISERTSSALQHKKRTGQKYSPVPFGYQEIEGRLESVESEAKVVAEIVKRRAGGETLQAIADSLNERGIRGKRGGIWHPRTIKYLIERQAA